MNITKTYLVTLLFLVAFVLLTASSKTEQLPLYEELAKELEIPIETKALPHILGKVPSSRIIFIPMLPGTECSQKHWSNC